MLTLSYSFSSESGQPICGNGMVEQGEECDCGYSDQCKDECCYDANQPEGKKCKLKPGKQCRYLVNFNNVNVPMKSLECSSWKLLSCVWLIATPWTIQSILQSIILEWVALPLLQWIFPTQGLNPGLPNCRRILHQLSHQGNPRILEWIACPFPRESSWPKNWNGGACIAGWFFY